ncbi:conserved hypothetical protein, secreted [Candidatus Magnetomorum sp. HK-1]|nr:conserved hypothetical protein, secreted [Candidatus Magnetomorum sp. HK-1]
MQKILTITLIVLLLNINNVSAELNDGLVAYYPFNSNANDESSNTNHGIVNGATLNKDRFGNDNSAYKFDGINDFISINDSESLNFSNGNFTISLWVKLLDKRDYHRLISKYKYDSGGWIVYASEKYFGCNIRGTSEFENLFFGEYNVEKWYFITVIKTSNKMKIFLNSKLAGMYSFEFGNTNISEPLLIGKYISHGMPSNYISGLIDDIRIYNREISEDEIKELFYFNGWSDFNVNYNDFDNDGIIDSFDQCENTATNSYVDKNGCPANGVFLTSQQATQIVNCMKNVQIILDSIGIEDAIKALEISAGLQKKN